MTKWLEDQRGNKCSVEYFGSEEAAQRALDSLEDCDNCINCSGCSGCSHCSDCSGCSRCSGCSDCSGCSHCSDCSGCSDCKNIAWLWDKENLRADPADAALSPGPPPVPVIPNIHQAVYAASSRPDSLNMSDVHTCENTHCRAGWVITLAGAQGAALEAFYNWELAAMLIYDASAPGFQINPARFYDSNEVALADMKRLADAEATAVPAAE